MKDSASAKFDWRMAGLIIAAWIASGAIQYGIITSKLDEHARRLEKIELKLEGHFLDREEFEKRHEELKQRVETNARRIEELEKSQRRK